ncbi:MAG TPA: bifunctional hydroxymethylpyrimidine kinase/phosphomethylpyrimidine kinase [Bacillota bacterium]|nr:bifunctional hydroxymethylpyrimidine kinase/phosphomethylpyrimidine kinase [Bacillota bacterium]
MSKQIYKALTIAGTDPTGGAGIQADLKTFQELKSYGMSVITSVVAQNTLGVQDVHHVPLEMIKEQLQSVFSDVPVHAFKTGMIANIDMMKVIKEAIQNKNIPFVIDPVMVATSGDPLIDEDARDFLRDELFPLSMVVTPNLPEAEVIVGKKITTVEEMKVAAKQIVEETGTKAALVKGGHLTGDAIDVLYDGKELFLFEEERIETKNTHGTGCTLSAAITAYLSQGDTLYEAMKKGKDYVTQAIKHSIDIGAGSGPTNHFAPRLHESISEV